jgi:alanyl-tRNA synthetase
MFKILSESGVAAGIRRIEAATGMNTYHEMARAEATLRKVSGMVKANPAQLVEKIAELEEQGKAQDREIAALKQQQAGSAAGEIAQNIVEIAGVKAAIAGVDGMEMDELRELSDRLKDKMGSGIAVIGTVNGGKINFIATATKDLVKRGFHAGNLIREVAQVAGGGGGGRPDMAQAGGKRPEKMADALEKAKDLIKDQLA